MHGFAEVHTGRQHCESGSFLPTHIHARAYAAVVLSGEYEECGSRGRFRVRAGDVLFHKAFDAHLNRIAPRGAAVLNLPLPSRVGAFAAGRLMDVDTIARTAERDCQAAVDMLLTQARAIAPAGSDWPESLAEEILRDPNCRLDRWAEARGLVPETISRGFAQVFGTTAARFRAEARARRALEQIVSTEIPLVDIAMAEGFADHAHMTRAVRALTGAAPRHWRAKSI
jgi:AraC-like DNA-binding protein